MPPPPPPPPPAPPPPNFGKSAGAPAPKDRNKLLSEIANPGMRLKKVDRSLINDRSAALVGGGAKGLLFGRNLTANFDENARKMSA